MVPTDFNRTLRYQAVADPASLLTDLKALRQGSQGAQSTRWLLVLLLIAWIVGSVIVGLVLAGSLFLFIAIPSGLLGAVVYWIVDAGYARLVLDERRLRLAAKAVRALACDLPPDGKLDLTVQFGPYNEAHYRTGEVPATNYNGTAYRLPWLRARGTLADGTKVELSTDLIARRKERTKTKGRMKVKEDLCEHVALVLRPKALPPEAKVRWPDLVRGGRLPATMRIQRAKVMDGQVILELRTFRQVRVTDKGTVLAGADAEQKLCDADGLLMPMLAAYRALDVVRAGRA